MRYSDNFTMEELLQFSDSNIIMLALGVGNPGAYKVIDELFKTFKLDHTKYDLIMNFIKNILNRDIVGARLWYIYKNEAKFNINELLNSNLDLFTNEYFYDKFEKYI